MGHTFLGQRPSMASASTIEKSLSKVKRKILVVSGKGGVGKSTVAAGLASQLVASGASVGVLDLDLCGPSMAQVFGLSSSSVHQSSSGWVPVYPAGQSSLCVMSIAFLLGSQNDPVVWRGPRKSAMVTQFLRDVVWGELDYLIIDTPPGTSDEHISVVKALADVKIDGAVVVTTPQMVALADVRREITFCQTTKIPILGLVENMSGFACPCCDEVTYVYGKGGGASLASLRDIPFLGSIPIDPRMGISADAGTTLQDQSTSSTSTSTSTSTEPSTEPSPLEDPASEELASEEPANGTESAEPSSSIPPPSTHMATIVSAIIAQLDQSD